jgi:hypothetical protein
MSTPSRTVHKILDIENILSAARNLNDAMFLAAAGLVDINNTNALQAIADEINNKLLIIGDRLEEVREELA